MYNIDSDSAIGNAFVDGSSSIQTLDNQQERLSILTGPILDYPAKSPRTLSRALIQAAATNGSVCIVDDRGNEKPLPYSELKQRALEVLASLQASGSQPGRHVVLQLDALEEFLTCFWACILGGMVPVPVLPFRNANNDDSSFNKLQIITSQLNEPLVLMSDHNASVIESARENAESAEALLPGVTISTFGQVSKSNEEGIVYTSKTNDVAFLQYTSGSTSFPKGTQITHANVLATVRAMIQSLGVERDTVMLNWMPYYHDMGIIAGHIMAVVTCCKVVAMKPFTFVRRPLMWLQKINEHRVTVTFSPNFGLKRILDKAKPSDLTHLDLSCLKVILNGAEPISIQTCHRFIDLLHTHCAMPKECLVPGYGLAEASLAVSIAPPSEVLRTHVLNREKLGCGDRVEHIHAEDQNATLFADEGPAVAGIEIRVVDDNDKILPEGTVGNIQIKGKSVTQGYFDNDAANREVFCGKWLRTGDLGFVYDDRFVITGRVKDVVFVNGQNYYSHDFEHACENIEGLERLVVIGHFDAERNEEDILAFVACNTRYIGAREKTQILRAAQVRINQCFDVTPTMFVLLKSTGEIPKTTSGKIMRHKLLDNYIEGHFANQCIHISELLEISPDLSGEKDAGKHVTIAEFKLLIRNWWSQVLGISENAIGDHDPFYSLGGTSIKAIEVLALAEETVDCVITHDMFKEYDTIHALANYIVRENITVRCRANKLVKLAPYREDMRGFDVAASAVELDESHDVDPVSVDLAPAIGEDEIAIIGMGCVFPQADNVDEFWNVLCEGRDCVTEFPGERGDIDAIYDPDADVNVDIFADRYNKSVSKWGSFIETHHFDPAYFNMNEQEAQVMDPHQRVFLNAAVQALQDSGLTEINGTRMGVFVGASGTGFYQQREDSLLTPSTLTGALANLAAARISNTFNLKGPSLSVDTACSSSLVSVDLAVKSILNGESDTAIAGGVQIVEGRMMYLMFSRAGILSPQGRCFAFSNQANGFVPGEGAGAVVLKRYSDAVRDGDQVYAVIKASASNNDGASLGIMAPNPEGQEDIIRTALDNAGIDPSNIGYVEAHGTGTNLGDLIEVRSLSVAFDERAELSRQKTPIGSIKTNMGHQLAAAGIAGLMKTALTVHHGKIPASLHCAPDNERKELKLDTTPFFVNRELSEWPADRSDRRYAAVNSFGFGGTNAHVILSNAYHKDIRYKGAVEDGECQLFVMSAKTPWAFEQSKKDFIHYAAGQGNKEKTCDVAYSYAARRDHFKQNRVAVVARNIEDAAAALAGEKRDGASVFENTGMAPTRKRAAWMFSGQGSQHPAMGKQLYRSEPVFREIVNYCDEIARPHFGQSLRDLLLSSTSLEQVSETAVTQPLVFTMDYALARLWRSWGIEPDFMLGHSIGEYVAACMAGVMDLDDAVELVVKRGALMGNLPQGGGMTAVLATAEDVLRYAADLPLDVAAYNGPISTVISGELSALGEMQQRLDKESVVYQPLTVSHAFHSRHMEPVLDEFRNVVASKTMREPSLRYASNVTGQLMEVEQDKEAFWPEYWAQHIRQPVRFYGGVNALVSAGAKIFMEVGAQEHLTGLAKRIVNTKETTLISSTPKAGQDINVQSHISDSLARLYSVGGEINWSSYFRHHGDRRCEPVEVKIDRRSSMDAAISRVKKVDIPQYPMERRSMYRCVGQHAYPFSHLLQRQGDNEFRYVPDESCVLFADHVVSQMPMLSGAGQCDLICHMFHQSASMVPKTLRNVAFHQPWLGGSKLQAEYSGEQEKTFTVKNAVGKPVVQAIASGTTSSLVPDAVDIEKIRQRMPMRFDRDALYDIFVDIGVNYGGFHRGVTALAASESESLASLHVAGGEADHPRNGYYLHPGMLDSAFQAAAGVLMAKAAGDGNIELPLMVPLGIETIHLYKYLQDGKYYSHVTPHDGDIMSGDIMACDISIYDQRGNTVVRIEKLQMRRMPQQAAAKPVARKVESVMAASAPAEARFFEHGWKLLADSAMAQDIGGTHWLLLGSPDGSEQQLANELSARGANCMLVPYEHYRDASIEQIGDIFERIDSIDGILYFGDLELELEQGSRDETGDMSTMHRVFNLLKALAAHGRKDKQFKRLRLVRISRRLFQHENTEQIDSRRSLTTGFMRSARVEFPLLDVRQLDIAAATPVEAIPALIAEMRDAGTVLDDGPEVLFVNAQRYSQDFVPVELPASRQKEQVFNSERSFWIIGGTSGVGKLLSLHIASQYQSTLVISGSRQLPDAEQYEDYLASHDEDDAIAGTIRHIRELEACGSRVLYVRTDVRSADSIRLSLEQIRKEVPSIDGIYFSALQLSDMMIVQKDWPAYRNMMDMRVYGLRELIRQTHEDELDFFVMFSSVAGLIGNLGQSDYSATDAYMDAIPFELRREGETSRYRSMQWGAWSLGQQVSEVILDHLKRNGMTHVTPESGIPALEEFLLSEQSSVAFIPGCADAGTLANNLFHLRQGSATRTRSKPRKQQDNKVEAGQPAPAVTPREEIVMSDPQKTQNMDMNSAQMQMLLQEFERQRDMFMRLCENQNALLSGSLDSLPASSMPMTAPAPAAPVAAPVAPAPQPVQQAPVAAPEPAPAAVDAMASAMQQPEVAVAPAQQAAPEPVAAAAETQAAPSERPDNLFDYIGSLMARTLEIDVSEIDPDQNIMELGADSMTAMSLVKEVETMYNIELPATLLFEYSTMNELVEYLQTEIE